MTNYKKLVDQFEKYTKEKLIKISKMVRKEINKDSLNDINYKMDKLSLSTQKKRKRKS